MVLGYYLLMAHIKSVNLAIPYWCLLQGIFVIMLYH